jgi:hypothetical protein
LLLLLLLLLFVALHRLGNGEARLEDSVAMNQWQYYKFEASQTGGYIMVEAKETTTTGNIWLYVNQAAPPTLTDYDYSNTKLDTANHVIYFPIRPSDQPLYYYVGVYGDPISQRNDPIPYNIVGMCDCVCVCVCVCAERYLYGTVT